MFQPMKGPYACAKNQWSDERVIQQLSMIILTIQSDSWCLYEIYPRRVVFVADENSSHVTHCLCLVYNMCHLLLVIVCDYMNSQKTMEHTYFTSILPQYKVQATLKISFLEQMKSTIPNYTSIGDILSTLLQLEVRSSAKWQKYRSRRHPFCRPAGFQ